MTTSTEYKKPLPRPVDSTLTKPFWEATKRREFLIPRCKHCGRLFWYPRSECPYCLSQDLDWQKASGKGRLYTFTVVYQPQDPRFNGDVPYVYAVIQLDEGVRIISNVIGCAIEDVKIDMPVEIVFEDVTPEVTLFKFKPA